MKLSANIVWREFDGELVILDLKSSTYLTTNASGAVLMKALSEDQTDAQLADTLIETFGISPEQAEQDVSTFINELSKGGLLESSGVA